MQAPATHKTDADVELSDELLIRLSVSLSDDGLLICLDRLTDTLEHTQDIDLRVCNW